MKVVTMILLLLSVGLFVQFSSGSDVFQDTTYYLDQELITCFKCRPGYYFVEHCTSDGGNSTCEKCPSGTFNSEYTRAESCALCSTECGSPSREYIAKNCSAVSNISCLCKEGHYRVPEPFGLCLLLNSCPAGQGVVVEGNASADTVCEDCQEGYFSANDSRTERCQKCQQCLNGMMEGEPCRSDMDRTCIDPGDKGFPTEAVIGIICGVIFVVIIAVVFICCFCVMKEKCAGIRKQLCRCCNRQYKECRQQEKTTNNGSVRPDDISVEIGNVSQVPDLLQNANEQKSPVTNKELNMLREDLVSLNYPQYFRFLFTNEADKHIDEMKLNHQSHGVKEIIYQILVKWRDLEQEAATPEKILTALKDWERPDLVEKYTNYFQQHSQDRSRNLSKSSVSTDV